MFQFDNPVLFYYYIGCCMPVVTEISFFNQLYPSKFLT